MHRRRRLRLLLVFAALLAALTAGVGHALATSGVSVKITSKPKAISASSTAVFRWKTSGKVRRTLCSMDRARFATCRRSKKYTRLHDGPHRFRVEVLGSGTSGKIASVRWRVDTTAPSAPTVTGGLSSWQSVPSVQIGAGGSTDGGSGLAGYQSRTSADGGVSWTVPAAGGQVVVSFDGETLVQFRSVDRAGNASAWSPTTSSADSTVRIDRDAPPPPTVSGGSLQWQNAPSVDVTATGTADVGGAGYGHHEYQTSTDGGATWSAAAIGDDVLVSADGETLVQFRTVDAAGNHSAWAPGAPNDGSTVRLDRTIPTSPVVSGGTGGWQNIASTLLTASGSTDAQGGGVAYYEHRQSTDGGTTWTTPVSGTTLSVSAEGETLVEFRAVDNANLDSAWTLVPVQIDRTSPTNPTVGGGSPAWQSVASLTISASASTDAGGSGLAGYQYRTSTDGGATWSSPLLGGTAVVSAEGETLVQLRAIDGAGNTSGWVGDTARIDRTLPTSPTVGGGSSAWQSAASVDVSASGSTDSGGSAVSGYEYRTSTNNGSTWSSPAAGSLVSVSAQGTTIVQFRALDGAGNQSAWAPLAPTSDSTVRLDHTLPTLSGVSGGSLTWKGVASITISAGTAADSGGSGFAHDEYRTSTDGAATWSSPASGTSVVISAEGETLVEFRAVDNAGNSSDWIPISATAGSTARLDRTAPTTPTLSGGSSAWQSVASITITANGSTDAGSGVAGYQYRTSTDGGATWSAATSGASASITSQGTTKVEFRSIDNVGKTSGWVSADARIDRTLPTAPTVTGGSTSWQNVPSITVSAAGSTDSGGSGLVGYQYRTSTDAGATWSAPSAGASLLVSAEGEMLVQFESIDNAGNESAWKQTTARIDRTAPTLPSVNGGSLAWQTTPSASVTASGSTDTGGSGFSYQYQTSTDNGATWSPIATGPTAMITSEGTTIVHFRAIDGAGNTTAWTPASPDATNTVKLDFTAPTTPSVSGGSASWQNTASVSITATGGSDTTSGLAGYQYRTSTDGGSTWSATQNGATATITTEGTTIAQMRSQDNAGNTSAWTPASPTGANTARIDRTLPTAPTSVTGGSLTWQTASPITITASGANDTLSGLRGLNVRTSTNGGNTWSTATLISGTSYNVTTDGTTIVQFQAVDNAGNVSAWTPASPGTGNTAQLDTVAPTLPTVSGGQGATTCKHKITISANGSTDATSGLAHYDYRISTNNGTTWGTTVTNQTTVTLTNKGTYLVQFHAVDNAGNISAWAPATAGKANTACVV